MRKTLFWTALYSTAAYIVLAIYNLFYLHGLDLSLNSEARIAALLANQQVTQMISITIFLLLVVELYYQKKYEHAKGPMLRLGTAYSSKEEIKSIHPDIPESYFQDPVEKSVQDRTNSEEIKSAEEIQKKANDDVTNHSH